MEKTLARALVKSFEAEKDGFTIIAHKGKGNVSTSPIVSYSVSLSGHSSGLQMLGVQRGCVKRLCLFLLSSY